MRERVLIMFMVTGLLAATCSPARCGDSVRPAAFAGRFYPANALALSDTVRELVAKSGRAVAGEVVAVIAPHAGYVFSGAIAAEAHAAWGTQVVDTVVIIGHDAYGGAIAHVSGDSSFETPLGRVAVDTGMVTKMMAAERGIRVADSLHRREHTIEVQLPFLQAMHRKCRIVPLLFGDPTLANVRRLVRAIEIASGSRKVVVLASTDMSHYPAYADACRLDRATLKEIGKGDAEGLLLYLATAEAAGGIPKLQTAMCARGGVATALLYGHRRDAKVETLRYANSGDVPAGDRAGVVGYSAAVCVRNVAP